MKDPLPETCLADKLTRLDCASVKPLGCSPVVATRVCALARIVRNLIEASCNYELSSRQQSRLASARRRADELLKPYGLMLDNPWGLCQYALPIGADGSTRNEATFLA